VSLQGYRYSLWVIKILYPVRLDQMMVLCTVLKSYSQQIKNNGE